MTLKHVGSWLWDATLVPVHMVGAAWNIVANVVESWKNAWLAFANVANKARQMTTSLFKPWFKLESLKSFPSKASFVDKRKTVFWNAGKAIVNSWKRVANSAKYALLSTPLTLATWAAMPVVGVAGSAITATKWIAQTAAWAVLDPLNAITKPFEQWIHDKWLKYSTVSKVDYTSYADYVEAAKQYRSESKQKKISKLEAKLAKLKWEKVSDSAPAQAPEKSQKVSRAESSEEPDSEEAAPEKKEYTPPKKQKPAPIWIPPIWKWWENKPEEKSKPASDDDDGSEKK